MINLDDLTLGQLKKIQNLSQEKKSSSFLQKHVGKYVICRTRNEGINCGVVEEIDETGIVLSEARRIYYHRPKDNKVSWYEGVAETGLSRDSKISCKTTKVIVEDYSLTYCTDVAVESLRSAITQSS